MTDHMTPETEADCIMTVLNLDGWDCQAVSDGVLTFTDQSAGRTKRFNLTITEVGYE